MLIYSFNLFGGMHKSGGLQAWSKEQGLGPCPVGVRGFKSHPPHFLPEKLARLYSFVMFSTTTTDESTQVLESR